MTILMNLEPCTTNWVARLVHRVQGCQIHQGYQINHFMQISGYNIRRDLIMI